MLHKIERIFGIATLFAALLTFVVRSYVIRELVFFLVGLSALFLVVIFVVGLGLLAWIFGRFAVRWVNAARSNTVGLMELQSKQLELTARNSPTIPINANKI